MTKKIEAFDISDFDTGVASDKGFKLELMHPTNNTPLGMFITVLGKHSQVFRDHIKEQINERLRRDANAERKGKPAAIPTAEDAERQAIELLVLCTTGWENIKYKGEILPFTTANAFTLYTEQLWVRSQVDDAIGELENFI